MRASRTSTRSKATIRAYYNAPDGIANKKSSRYITEMKALRDKWAPRLKERCANQVAYGNRPAVVFDADDTTLWTYDMEDDAMAFNFDPALQDVWVQDQRFPAVPGMKRVVKAAKNAGCKVIGLTGRSADQRKATLKNLHKYYGDAFRSKYFFAKWADGSSRRTSPARSPTSAPAWSSSRRRGPTPRRSSR